MLREIVHKSVPTILFHFQSIHIEKSHQVVNSINAVIAVLCSSFHIFAYLINILLLQ